MTPEEEARHALSEFPAAATEFVSALNANRRRIAEDVGLSATELRALFHVARGVAIRPTELAERLDLTTGAVTAIARSLADAGLLRRVEHPRDRRGRYLQLTDAGHACMTRIHDDFEAMIADSTSGLDADELQRFTAALRLVSAEVRARLAARDGQGAADRSP